MELTNGILDALSFQTAKSPRDAKKPNPPHSHANASYCNSHTKRKKKKKKESEMVKFRHRTKERGKNKKLEHFSDGGGDAIDAWFRESSAIVPNELVVDGKLVMQQKQDGVVIFQF